jgi:hypothetical protein
MTDVIGCEDPYPKSASGKNIPQVIVVTDSGQIIPNKCSGHLRRPGPAIPTRRPQFRSTNRRPGSEDPVTFTGLRNIDVTSTGADWRLAVCLPGLPARLLFGYQCLMVLIDGDPFPNSNES